MKNNNEDLRLKLIEDNVNVSETNDLKEFFIMVFGLFLVVCIIFFGVDIFGKIYISRMSVETQYKIEKLYKTSISDKNYSNKISENSKKINRIGNKILNEDNLTDSNIEFHIMDKNETNAFVAPSGDIYVTTELMKEIKDNEEMLAFVLAHEIGHYKNKHHFQVISRKLTIALITLFLFQDRSLNSFVNDINENFDKHYSKKQEFEADNYASEMTIKLYGSNKAGIEFFKLIDKKYNLPEFVHYFSTHPSPKERIRELEK